MNALSASQRRAADPTSVSSTACKSNVDRLMTLSTSAVAVCCCSDSRSSLSRRTFSMAMTAWLAKFLTKHGGFGIVRLHEVEVALRSGRTEIGDRTLVDAMGAGDDAALRGLPEHLGEAHHGQGAG